MSKKHYGTICFMNVQFHLLNKMAIHFSFAGLEVYYFHAPG